MLQYKIPQNIGIEDKIVGPFSLKQLIIVAVGGGTSYVLFAIASKLYELSVLEYIIIALPGVIALAVALIKINNLTFTHYILLALEFAIKPKKRLWDHRGISMLVEPDLSGIQKSEGVKTEKKAKKNVNLNDLSRILDSGGFEGVQTVQHDDIDETIDDNLMVEAFFGNKKGEGENMWARTAKDKDGYKRKLNLLSKLPKPELQALKEVKEQIALLKRQQEEIAGLDAPKSAQGGKVKKTPVIQATLVEPPIHKTVTHTVESAPPKPKTESEPVKKKRKRNRKRKPKTAMPVRHETQINNTQGKKPVELLPKSSAATDTTTAPQPNKQINQKTSPDNNSTSGTIHFEELQKGDVDLTI